MPQIANADNLLLAFYKARRGGRHKKATQYFEQNLHTETLRLLEHLNTGCIQVGFYHMFTIYEPKKRVIAACSFPEKVLHHALMNVCHNIFERVQIFDSYASRKGKGIHAALHRARFFARRNQWFLKLDVRHYFDSIDHAILMRQLEKCFGDPILLDVFQQIIQSYEVRPGKGVPIGNLTSQYFSNHYLAGLDHFVKEQLNIKGYVRYMDDLVLWHNNLQTLKRAQSGIQDYLMEKCQLTLKPAVLQKTSQGLPFLGYLVFPTHNALLMRSKRRFIQKMNRADQNLSNGTWSEREWQQHVFPLLGFTAHAHTFRFRKALFYEGERMS